MSVLARSVGNAFRNKIRTAAVVAVLAVAIGLAGSRDIWTVDVGLKTMKRLTFDPANDDNPVWSPDGKHIAFASNRTGERKLYVKPADGSREERLLTDQPGAPRDNDLLFARHP